VLPLSYLPHLALLSQELCLQVPKDVQTFLGLKAVGPCILCAFCSDMALTVDHNTEWWIHMFCR
jgi:hypothetical protein